MAQKDAFDADRTISDGNWSPDQSGDRLRSNERDADSGADDPELLATERRPNTRAVRPVRAPSPAYEVDEEATLARPGAFENVHDETGPITPQRIDAFERQLGMPPKTDPKVPSSRGHGAPIDLDSSATKFAPMTMPEGVPAVPLPFVEVPKTPERKPEEDVQKQLVRAAIAAVVLLGLTIVFALSGK